MKHFKKLVSLLLTAVMVLAMCIPVMADDTNKYTITILNAGTNHTYEAYQVFSGNTSGGKLTDIAWGNGVNSFTYAEKTTAQDIVAILSESNVADFAKVAGANLATAAGESEISNGNCIIKNLSAGYYLIKDKNSTVPSNSAYTDFILKVAGNVDVTTKMDVPTVEKKVKENVKKTNENGNETDTRIPSYTIPSQYNDVADYNIGDKVPFQLIGTMPSNIDSYNTYYYEFIDTLSKGLTYDNDATITLKDHDANTNTDIMKTISGNVTWSSDQDTGITTLQIIFGDIKEIADDAEFTITANTKVIVDYTATLNESANIGIAGNENDVKLKFSNNPNADGKGETAPDKVIVFTYELDVEKIDGTDNNIKLKDAIFILKNSDGSKYAKVENGKFKEWTTIKEKATQLATDEHGLIKVAGLDDGQYLIEEIKAPSGYNKLTGDVTVVITATTVNGQTWNGTDAAITNFSVNKGQAEISTGIAKIQIANNSGSTLPETGGIGTTIFYVVGVVLMLGAGVLLITKRRMSAKH